MNGLFVYHTLIARDLLSLRVLPEDFSMCNNCVPTIMYV